MNVGWSCVGLVFRSERMKNEDCFKPFRPILTIAGQWEVRWKGGTVLLEERNVARMKPNQTSQTSSHPTIQRRSPASWVGEGAGANPGPPHARWVTDHDRITYRMADECQRGQKEGSFGRWGLVMNTYISMPEDMQQVGMPDLLGCQQRVLRHDWIQIGSVA